MVPVGATFRKMNRVVRDLSMRSGKQIELVLRGEETELDRNIVEEIHDPLLHMIRNSVDHGIEKPEAREAVGKSPAGQITLAAFHQGGNVVIQIQDDGAGLDRDRILKKAVAQGLVASSTDDLSEQEVFNLIFAPGFSTAEKVTDISGRGVGMDVVRRNIETLRGKIEIQSAPGQGTTFSIHLPLTLAIIDGLIVRIGEHRYILPTLSVRESLRATPDMLSTVHRRGEIVDVRGRLLPLLRLNEFLQIESDSADPTHGVVVVVESDGAARCLLVDELLGKQEVVIKTLGETFQSNPLLAGAAILGDGRVGLILDVASLAHPKSNHSLSKAA
jgi:two-component system chemotaxis sensor kinase CheA